MALSSVTLSTSSGISIPALGLGTFEAGPNDAGKCEKAVIAALKAGCRHIDTAAFYSCEEDVGRAIRKSGVPREDIFICTKFWQQYHAPEDVWKSLDESLKRLNLAYVDLFLMHWPLAFKRTEDGQVQTYSDGKPVVDEDLSNDHLPTWRAMEAIVHSGKARAIGVSNFKQTQLEKLLSYADIKPFCNQVESHPWFPQTSLLEFCRQNDILFVAYSPLGSQPGAMHVVKARLFEDDDVLAVARRSGQEPPQVLISWAIQRGTVAIPKSSSPQRIEQNLKARRLDPEDFELISSITKRHPSKLMRFVNFDSNWGTHQFDDDKIV